jgi:hypothetical protein
MGSPTCSSSATTPLSLSEQNALLDCVKGGGGAIIVVDNDTFAGPGTDSVNQSFISSFGLHVTGTLTATQPATLSAPGNMITDGPFGNVSCLIIF